MANKPIDKNYLISSLKNFDEQVLSKKYNNSTGGDNNAIESISVNGATLTPDEHKNVDITVPDVSELETNSHRHENKDVLDKLSESDEGILLFDGNEIQGGSGATGTDGVDGKSAYEIACDNGFEGTEEEWLKSLKGEDGVDGQDGKSITSIEKDDSNNIIVTFSDNTTQNIGQLNLDVTADFLGETGFGNLRYYDGRFQYHNVSSAKWIDTAVSPDNVFLINMIPQSMKKIHGMFDIGLGKNKLKWEEPDDTIYDGQVFCFVERVIIKRKLGSVPTSVEDGDLVIDIPRKNFYMYKDVWYVDEDVIPVEGDTYYYKVFPKSSTGYYNDVIENEVNIAWKDYYLFGFQIDQTESDPASMITYLEDCDNADFSSAYMDYTNDVFNYGDWAVDNGAWFMDVKPCMLKYDGTVDYYLNPDDYTLKEDGTESDVANTDYEGNVMIQFPKVYYACVKISEDIAEYYFSSKKIDDTYHCWSHIDNNGNEIDYCYLPAFNGSNINNVLRSISGQTPINSVSGITEIEYALANNKTEDIIWNTEVFSDRQLVDLLLLLIGKSTDTQTVFGNGHYSGGSSASNLLKTGTMNSKGLFWGTNGTGSGVKVFGMEHWWGNQWRRIAGWINDKGNQKIKMTYGQSDGSTVDGYNTDGSGYISIGCTPSGTSGGYISKMTVTKNGLIPTMVSGSATTYYTDGLWFNNSQVDYAFVGGSSAYRLPVGAFCSALNVLSSHADWDVGAAVSCKPLA